MSKLDLKERHVAERARFAARVPIAISQYDTCDSADHRVLYVLGFGIAGSDRHERACVHLFRGVLRVRVNKATS
jgi:hypothetical protein